MNRFNIRGNCGYLEQSYNALLYHDEAQLTDRNERFPIQQRPSRSRHARIRKQPTTRLQTAPYSALSQARMRETRSSRGQIRASHTLTLLPIERTLGPNTFVNTTTMRAGGTDSETRSAFSPPTTSLFSNKVNGVMRKRRGNRGVL